jgi:hypothetical protein
MHSDVGESANSSGRPRSCIITYILSAHLRDLTVRRPNCEAGFSVHVSSNTACKSVTASFTKHMQLNISKEFRKMGPYIYTIHCHNVKFYYVMLYGSSYNTTIWNN